MATRKPKAPVEPATKQALSETYAARAARGRGLISLTASEETKAHIATLAARWQVTKSDAVARAVAETLARELTPVPKK